MKNIDEIIIEIEKRANLLDVSIAYLCRKAGIANSTFSRWKHKNNKPRIESVLKINDVLDNLERIDS